MPMATFVLVDYHPNFEDGLVEFPDGAFYRECPDRFQKGLQRET